MKEIAGYTLVDDNTVYVKLGMHDQLVRGGEECRREFLNDIPVIVESRTPGGGAQKLMVIPGKSGSVFEGTVVGEVRNTNNLHSIWKRLREKHVEASGDSRPLVDNKDQTPEPQVPKTESPAAGMKVVVDGRPKIDPRPPAETAAVISEPQIVAIVQKAVQEAMQKALRPPTLHEDAASSHQPESVKISPEPAADVGNVASEWESLKIPDLQAEPCRPKFRINFITPEGARYSAYYHWVWVSPRRDLYLVYDCRFVGGIEFDPPELENQPLQVVVNNEKYSCWSMGLVMEFGVFKIICLPCASGPPLPRNEFRAVENEDSPVRERETRNGSAKDTAVGKPRLMDLLSSVASDDQNHDILGDLPSDFESSDGSFFMGRNL